MRSQEGIIRLCWDRPCGRLAGLGANLRAALRLSGVSATAGAPPGGRSAWGDKSGAAGKSVRIKRPNSPAAINRKGFFLERKDAFGGENLIRRVGPKLTQKRQERIFRVIVVILSKGY